MACPDCEARRKLARDAFFNAQVGQAAKHVIKGVAEVAGLKEKTGESELDSVSLNQDPAESDKARSGIFSED